MFRVKGGELHVEISADGQGNGRRCKDELDQRRQAGDQSAFFAKGAATVGERAACVRDRRSQFGEAENEAGVHGRDHERGHQKAERSGYAPAVAPAKVLAGNHQPDRDPP